MRPTFRLVLWFAAGIPVALLPAILSPPWALAWVAWIGLGLAAAALDAVVAPRVAAVDVSVTTPAGIPVGDSDDLVVRAATPRSTFETRIRVRADLHEGFERAIDARIDVPAAGEAEGRLRLRPRRRGAPTVDALWLAWTGPLGLVERRVALPVGARVAVTPDVRPVRAAALRFFTSREFAVGTKTERYVGDGSEFESLRDWVTGLDPRAISWRATARHQKLVCQEFRAERDHQVVVAFDTGLRMREPLSGMPRLDHAIHAGLLLAYVALKTGDRVGVFAFDEKVGTWLEPDGGVGAFPRVQRALTGLDYSSSETNFTLGLADLAGRLRRRSLVVIPTEFGDSVTAGLMVDAIGRLVARHVVVFVALRDPLVDEAAGEPPATTGALYRAVVAADFAREREGVLKRLRRMGVHVIDAPPSGVSVALVNRYLDVHRRELVG
jgi:uncharacterized protein (DUF58 family)